MWDLPRPGIEPVSPALAGRVLTTAPPGKSSSYTSDCNLFGVTSEIKCDCTHTSLEAIQSHYRTGKLEKESI